MIDGWVDDLTAWFQRSKVYLYDSLEHWIDVGATEGFGLPPLEALANGCMVFSGVNDALADYLDPGFNCRKLRVHSLQWDVAAILDAIRNGGPCSPDSLFHPYTTQQVTGRLSILLSEIQRFFEVAGPAERDIEDLWEGRRPSALQRLKGAAKVLCGASHPVPR
ncbi:glycosyltransferase [Novosphingobium panipatense]|uniref:glycosyltransferase n=1 Tax=Novosphingobium panipatense TaxID=428991 RepID=UPI00360B34BB